jgi:hypothetical protein
MSGRQPNKSHAILQSLGSGESAWCWMVDRGPFGDPFYIVQERATDPEGDRFMRRTRMVLGDCPPDRQAAHGVLTRQADQLILHTRSPAEQAGRAHVALARASGLPLLRKMRIVQVDDGEIVRDLQSINLSQETLTLQAILLGERAWFACVGEPGAVEVLLSDRQKTMRDYLAEAFTVPPSRNIQGRIWLDEDERLNLGVRAEAPELRPAILQWVRQHRQQWPILESIQEVVITVTPPK